MSTSTRQKTSSKQGTSKETDDKQQKSPSPDDASLNAISCQLTSEAALLEEIKKLREENKEGHGQTRTSLDRLVQAVADIRSQIGEHEERIIGLEERMSMVEDTAAIQQRALRHLLRRETELTATCDDLQNRLRRNNLRIFQIPEGSEGENMIQFVKDLLHKVLTLPSDIDIRIERAHRSLQSKPNDPTAPPRSIIVRFLDAAVKDRVLQQAWSQGQVSFQDKRIFFDQDYSPELQKKRAKVHAVVKQLRQNGIGAKCMYPARLKLKLDSGEKIFTTLMSATEVLKDLGIKVHCGEKERIEERLREGWARSAKRREEVLSSSDFKAIMQEED